MTVRRILPLAFAAGLLASPRAQAFEMAGFKAGMSRQAFLSHARATGYEVKGLDELGNPIPEAEWAEQKNQAFALDRAQAPARLGVEFCGDRLRSVKETFRGGLDEYARAVADAQRYLGPGKVGPTLSNKAPRGFFTRTSASWTDPSGQNTHSVGIVSVGGDASVSRGWTARTKECPDE